MEKVIMAQIKEVFSICCSTKKDYMLALGLHQLRPFTKVLSWDTDFDAV